MQKYADEENFFSFSLLYPTIIAATAVEEKKMLNNNRLGKQKKNIKKSHLISYCCYL